MQVNMNNSLQFVRKKKFIDNIKKYSNVVK